jgi:hypothetical protein
MQFHYDGEIITEVPVTLNTSGDTPFAILGFDRFPRYGRQS